MNRLPEEIDKALPDLTTAEMYRCLALADLLADWEAEAWEKAREGS